jgi:capsular exopolysaccharide synthesis family protein
VASWLRRTVNPRSTRRANQLTAREAFRVLRSNLLVAISELANPVVVVTSAYESEGKTSVCVSLAESIAAAGPRVVVVDMDLRHSEAHRRLAAYNEAGLSDVLLGRAELEDCLQYIELPAPDVERPAGLHFLAAGPAVANPTELLATPRTAQLLESLASQADIVLLDTPPVLPVADTLVIGRHAAGAVLVVEARGTPGPAAKRAKDTLTRNQTRLLGVVLNKFDIDDASYGIGDTNGYGLGHGLGYGLDPKVPATPNGRNGRSGNGSGA